MDWTHTAAPTLADFEALAARALESLPQVILAQCGAVVVQVHDLADEDVLADMEIDNPYELTGLYQGVDLAERALGESAILPSLVILYRLPLLAEWCEGDMTLGRLVFHVMVHEIGHHFGLSDDAIEAIESAADFEETP